MRTADDIRIELDAPNVASIKIGKVFPAASATASVADENARRLLERPMFWAEYGPKTIATTPDENAALTHGGAQVTDGIQRP